MSGFNEEVIAKLVGLLKFNVDSSGLHRFSAMMKSTEKQMQRIGQQADALSLKLNKAFSVTGKGGSAQKLKLDAEVRKSLDKELATETKLSKLRRQQFATQLAEQKLVSAGTRQESLLQNDALRTQQQQAVLLAKQHKAQQEALKVELGKRKLMVSAEQSQLRQARLADILQKRQARTVELQRKAAAHQTALQRAEVALQNARANGIRQAEKYRVSKVAAAAREARAAVRQDQASQRFSFAAERHEAWKARQSEPKGMDFGGLAVGVTAASAALYTLVRGVSYLSERVVQRQAGAVDAESFDTALRSAGGKNPDNQKFARDSFIEVSNKYGVELSPESAKSYALFIQGQLALGKTLTQAAKMFEDQSATFRAAALDREAQKRAAYQLNQIRAKGKPEGSDVNDLFDAVGGVVAASIRQAAATRLGFKGKIEEQAGWFKKAVTDGKILAKDFDAGMSNFLRANQDILAQQMGSISAAQQRAENQTYLNDNSINSSQELKGVILERIQAERELNQAMQPFKETLATFDLGLTKLSASMLRLAAGRNADGSEKTEQQQVQDRMSTNDVAIDTKMVGTGDYSGVNGDAQQQGGPIGKFWNWLFNVPDYREGPANKPMLDWSLVSVAGLKFPPLDLSKLAIEPPGEYRQFRLPPPITAADLIEGVIAQQQRQSTYGIAPFGFNPDGTPSHNSASGAQTINTTNNTNVEVRVDVHAAEPDPDGEKLGEAVGRHVDDKIRGILQTARANQQEVE